MRKAVRVVSQSSARPRFHRVECVIYPTKDESVIKKSVSEVKSEMNRSKSPVTLKEPSIQRESGSTESNPFGFIHYIAPSDQSDKITHNIVVEGEDLITLVLPTSDNIESNNDEEMISYNDDEMTFLLPRSLLNSSLESMCHSGTDNMLSQLGVSHETDESSSPCHPAYLQPNAAPWGKRLPNYNDQFQSQQYVNYERYRVASEGYFGPQPSIARPAMPNMMHSNSLPLLNKSEVRPRQSKQNNPAFTKEESPPNWISCFPSPKSKRKSAKIPEDVYTKAVRSQDDSPIKYIDKTPSENSLNLPYCPPVKIDYENFSNSELFKLNRNITENERRVDSPKIPKRRAHSKIRSRSLSRTRTSQLAVIPIDDPSALEKPKQHYSQVVAHIDMYPTQKSQQAARCTCDSRRSSDSGLADMLTHADHCPLSPHSTKGSSQSMSSIPLFMSPSSSRLSHISSNHSSNRHIYKHHRPPQGQVQTPTDLHQISEIPPPSPDRPPRRTSAQCMQCTCSPNRQNDQQKCHFNSIDSHMNATFHPPQYQYTRSPTSNYPKRSSNLPESPLDQERPPHPHLTTLYSLSLDDIQNPYRDQADQAFSCSDIPNTIPSQPIVPPAGWNRTKETYKTGLYAHWWLNASLQPITEEFIPETMSTNL